MQISPRRFAINPHDLVIGATGIEDFFDPVPRDEIETFRDALLPRTAAFGRTLKRRIDRDTVACCAGHFAVFVLRCFKTTQIVSRCRAAGIEISAPETDFLTAFTRLDLSPAEIFAKRVLRGLPPRAPWKAPARFIRNLFKRGCIIDREFRSVDLKNEIVVTSISPFLQKHAGAVERPVVYCPASRWFGPLPQMATTALASISDGLVESARQSFNSVGVDFDNASEKMITRWAEVFPAAVQARLIDFERKARELPRELWIGSSGPIWSRTFAHAVRSAGGKVTGHDHGTGIGFLATNVKSINDFEAADRFLTFTDMQVKGLERSFRSEILVRTDRPQIGLASGAKVLFGPLAESNPAGGKKVMFVISNFTGSGVDMYPREMDLVRLDWYVRLVAWLRSQGFEVLLKPHPECKYGVPRILRSLAGDRVLQEPFGEVWEQANILLYDFPQTSTFGEGLASDRPIVFVGFQLDAFDREALDLLSRRCAIVEGFKDDCGRRQVDWNVLSEAFATAPMLSDPAFFEAYLAY